MAIPHEPMSWNGDRPRRWYASIIGAGQNVVVRHSAILQPGEDLTEYPPTLELTWDEWVDTHSNYGLNLDGTPVEEA
ncbi:hypothetical protein ACFFX1_55050 [Dactylosporangium sucinum]|uniref:Uncharacterized protein n=1 Tax=Dactylosporangium sucinum TaxID=1424081 RepID=A0A917U2B6_9ACTN|nr:hypothetical protein [Dactylosporangium sucinum]GGM53142.1 hypothetical protein GCM10007977_063500 [Dactylosporangium sucinum]